MRIPRDEKVGRLLRGDEAAMPSAGGVRILRLVGEFDATDAQALAARLDAAVSAGPPRLVVDLKGVRFASVALLGRLLAARAKARKRGGDLVVSAPSGPVRAILRVQGLGRALRVFAAEGDAIRHFVAAAAASDAGAGSQSIRPPYRWGASGQTSVDLNDRLDWSPAATALPK